MTGEGKAASTGVPGKIKVMFQIFPPRAMGHTSSSSPNITVQVIYEDGEIHRGKCGRNCVGGLLGRILK